MTGEKKASATKYHRRVLMETADRLLSEYGYAGMNMNMLAKEADYSKATVYVYFPSKDEIVRAILIERLDLMKRELALALKSDLSSDELMHEIERVVKEFAAEDGIYFDFMCEHATDTDGTAPEVKKAVGEILDELCTVFDRNELLDKFYTFYGRRKTEGLFGT